MAENSHKSARRRGRWVTALLLIIVAVVLLAAWVSVSKKQIPVQTSRTVKSDISSTISTNGKIAPMDNQGFEAHAPGPTTVRRVLVHEGDHAQTGELLLQLDDADARAQAARAHAQLEAAKADLHAIHSGGTREEVITLQAQLEKAQNQEEVATRNRDALRRLQQQGAASAAEVAAAEEKLKAAEADLNLARAKQTRRYSNPEVEKAQAQADQAKAALAAAEDLLSHSDIRSPRAGVVYSLPVRAGQFVNAGDLLVQVADLSTVQVVGYVDEPDIGRLRPGEPVQVTWEAIPGRVWQGTLTRMPSTVVKLEARTVGEVSCRVDNADLKLLPNVNVGLNIITAQASNVVLAPREAVHEEDGRRFVYQIIHDRLRRQDVITGISNLTQVEITSGLAENVEVALGAVGGQPLRDGMPVSSSNKQ